MLNDHDMETARNVARDILLRLDMPGGSVNVALNVSEDPDAKPCNKISFTVYLRNLEDRPKEKRFNIHYGYWVSWEQMPLVIAG